MPPEADGGEPGEEDADEHQPPGPEAVDDDAREEAEERADHQLARALPEVTCGAGPAQLADEEVVEEGQAVEAKPTIEKRAKKAVATASAWYRLREASGSLVMPSGLP